MKPLKHFCSFQPGTHLGSEFYDEDSGFFLLNLRDFNENLDYAGNAVGINLPENKEKYVLKKNDVLFSTRLKFNAFDVPEDADATFVASNSFVILQPDTRLITPEYLRWILNHPETQKMLAYLSQAQSRMPFISIKKLQELEIPVPNLDKQKEITKIHQLQQKEKKLYQNLILKKETYIQSFLLKFIQK